jgi:hypothetical protein
MKNQRGVVSLITSILISLLFVVVVVSMVNVLTREQRQSTAADQSSRAYYAAETGIEDGLAKVKNALAQPAPLVALSAAEQGGSCIVPAASTNAAPYSCLILSRQSNILSGILKRDGASEQIDLSSVTQPIGKIVIDWNLTGGQGGDSPVDSLSSLPTSATQFDGGAQWGNKPAVLEATTIRFTTAGGGLFDATNATQLNILENLIVPTQSGSGSIPDYSANNAIHQPVAGVCTTTTTSSNPYNCHMTLNVTDSATYNHVIRLRARYNGAHFAVHVYDTSGTLVSVPDQYETIDVTAKANNTSRRVRAKVAIFQNTASLDYALFSDHDICKDFALRDSRSGNTGGNGLDSANQGSCPF